MKIFFATICLLICFNSYSQSRFEIQGTLSDAAPKWIYLKYQGEATGEILDSAHVHDGLFSFSGQVDQPTSAILKLNRYPIPDEKNLNILQIILVPAEIAVKVNYNDFSHGIVTGSDAHNEFNQLRKNIEPFSDKYLLLRDSLGKMEQTKSDLNTNRTLIAELNQSINKAIADIRKTSFIFIEEHPDSWVSALELNSLKATWGIDSVKYLYGRLNENIKKSREAKSVLRKITMSDEAKSSIGSFAADFSVNDVNGLPIRLSDFKGRYVLLDFWGSWCGPCRIGNPHLIKLYKRFGGGKLEFIGVGCQDRPVPWRKAIEKDGIGIWKHILDFDQNDLSRTGQKRTIAEQFAVNSFPTKILLDRSGKVIARFYGGDDEKLDAKLAELLE